MKINIIGTTASGKSTFGRKLAEVNGFAFIEMDELFWGPDWYAPPDTEFFKNLEAAISCSSWVLDGNYTRTTHIKWKQVDVVIWLDYSFLRTITQSVARTVKRSYFKTELWPNTGNHETFGRMLSTDSIIWWCVKNYSKNRKKYKKMMRNPDYSHIRFVRLRSPQQAREYIASYSLNSSPQ